MKLFLLVIIVIVIILTALFLLYTREGKDIIIELDGVLGKFRHHTSHISPPPKFGNISTPIVLDMEIPKIFGGSYDLQALISLNLYDKDNSTYRTIKTAVDSGSSALVVPTDACKTCKGHYGTWNSKASGKESGGEKDFKYGGGDYDGGYWNTICTFDREASVQLEFAGIDKVRSGDADLAGIGGMMPQSAEHPGFITQIYNNLDRTLPKSFIFDMKMQKCTIGARGKGVSEHYLTGEQFAIEFNRDTAEAPYYMVYIKEIRVSVDGGKQEKIDKPPKNAIIDTGTTSMGVGKKVASALRDLAKGAKYSVRIAVELVGGSILVCDYKPEILAPNSGGVMESDLLEKVDSLLVGIMFMKNRVLSFDSDMNTILIE